MASPEETGGELVPLRQGDGEKGPVHPRAEMVKVLAEQGFGRNEIARRSGIPEVTVSRLADSLGISFDRSKTDEALKARLADLRQAQMGMALGFFEDIIEARIRLRTSSTARDFAFHSKSISDLTQAYQRMIPEWTSADSVEDAKSLAGEMLAGIKEFAKVLDAQDDLYDQGKLEGLDPAYIEYRRNNPR